MENTYDHDPKHITSPIKHDGRQRAVIGMHEAEASNYQQVQDFKQ